MSRHRLRIAAFVLVLVGVLAAAGSSATPGAAASPAPLAAVRLDGLTPSVADADDTLSLTGTVANTSAGRLTALNVYLQISRVPLRSSDDLAPVDVSNPDDLPGVRTTFFVPASDLAPGRSATFRLDVAVGNLGLDETGVYLIGVVVRAFVPDGSRANVGSAMTVLPYVPDPSAIGTVGVAWVWPLTAAVDRAEDGTFRNDGLGAAMEPSGALGAAFGAAADTPVTWLVDPAVAQAAADMAGGYSVAAAGSSPQPGAHSEAAGAWLARLRSAAARGNVVLLPYGDVDSVALTRAGLGADLASALAVRAAVNPDLVPGAIDNIGVAPGGFVDGPTVEAFGDAGITRLLVASAGLDTPTDPHATHATVRVQGRTYDAVRMEAPAASGVPQSGVQRRQTLLAQTAFAAMRSGLEAAAGSAARSTLILTPPAEPLTGSLVGSLLDIAASAPWVRSATLAEATAAPAVDGSLTYPAEARAAELPSAYLAQVKALRTRLSVLAALTNSPTDDAVPIRSPAASPSADPAPTTPSGSTDPRAGLDPSAVGVARELSVLRAESAAWRPDLAAANAAVAGRIAALGLELTSVHLASTGKVTLSSNRGRFPLTVQNELDEAVTVRLDLRPRTPTRLRMSDIPDVSIGAGQLATVNVDAEAAANGTFIVDVQLVAPNGAALGPPTALTLRATEYDTVAWIVIIIAGGLLFAASGVRIGRRIVRARRT